METILVRTKVACGIGAVLLVLGGCGGSSPTGTGGGDPGGGGNGGNGSGGPPDPVSTTQVSVADDVFLPEDIAVSANATVTWTWVGSDFHDVVWTSAQLDDSPLQRTGVHEVTMPAAGGEYGYYCTIHGSPTSGMGGSVTVR